MTFPKAPPPTWPQILTLLSLLTTGGYLGGKASADPTVPHHKASDDAALIISIGELKNTIEKLTDQVNVLNTRMAVVEDRQKRPGR